jgi:hypothetical protein
VGYGTVSIHSDLLVRWLGEDSEHHYHIAEGIPEGAEVVAVKFSPMLKRIIIALRHPNLGGAWDNDLASMPNIAIEPYTIYESQT